MGIVLQFTQSLLYPLPHSHLGFLRNLQQPLGFSTPKALCSLVSIQNTLSSWHTEDQSPLFTSFHDGLCPLALHNPHLGPYRLEDPPASLELNHCFMLNTKRIIFLKLHPEMAPLPTNILGSPSTLPLLFQDIKQVGR